MSDLPFYIRQRLVFCVVYLFVCLFVFPLSFTKIVLQSAHRYGNTSMCLTLLSIAQNGIIFLLSIQHVWCDL